VSFASSSCCFYSSAGSRCSQRRVASRASLRSTRQPHTSSSPCRLERSTRNWFEQVVIGERLCPFAPPLLLRQGQQQALRIVSSDATVEAEATAKVADEVQLLMKEPEQRTHETTLIVFDNHAFVHDFRDFVRLSWKLQEKVIEETYGMNQLQLVLFHPRASHQTYKESGPEGDDDDDDEQAAGDYTIRSPYPTIHLLREEDVLRAVTSGYPQLDTLPHRNRAKFTAQGLDMCKARLAAAYQVGEPAADTLIVLPLVGRK
jgi:hypothetical protein